MSHLLTIDIGNTNITAGIFRGSRIIGKRKIPTHELSSYRANFERFFKSCGIKPGELEGVIISSVVPDALSRLSAYIKKTAGGRICIVGKNIRVPVKNLYRVKEEVGQDRLVNAFAAKLLYGAPCVIVDFGTAITFDVVSRKGEYMGGLILPGIELSLHGLYEKTALLPKVKLKKAPNIIGKDTASSMRGGILFGFGAMCDGLVSRYRSVLGPSARVVATGGNAGLIKTYTKSIQIVDDDLTIKGLFLIAGGRST